MTKNYLVKWIEFLLVFIIMWLVRIWNPEDPDEDTEIEIDGEIHAGRNSGVVCAENDCSDKRTGFIERLFGRK